MQPYTYLEVQAERNRCYGSTIQAPTLLCRFLGAPRAAASRGRASRTGSAGCSRPQPCIQARPPGASRETHRRRESKAWSCGRQRPPEALPENLAERMQPFNSVSIPGLASPQINTIAVPASVSLTVFALTTQQARRARGSSHIEERQRLSR